MRASLRRRRLGPILLALAGLVAEGGGTALSQEPVEPVLGAASDFAEAPPTPSLDVEAGAELRADPSWEALILATVDMATQLEIVEYRNGWVRVRYASFKGWMPTAGTVRAVPDTSSPEAEPEPSRLVPTRDETRIRRARELLGEAADPATLGPFMLVTDIPSGAFLDRLAKLAEGLLESYTKRYGLPSPTLTGQAVVLFSTEESYRAYELDEGSLAGMGVAGHATRNIAALFVGERDADATGAVLVHELTHLLNRRAVADRPPAWLEEGMANDLAYCRIQADGTLALGSLGGKAQRFVLPGRRGSLTTLNLVGPTASLNILQTAAARGRMQPLSALVDLGWGEFVIPERREMNYAQSAFFIRFLLEGDQRRLAPGFRAYLAAVAQGGSGDADSLLSHLGRDWRQLDRDFVAWLKFSARL